MYPLLRCAIPLFAALLATVPSVASQPPTAEKINSYFLSGIAHDKTAKVPGTSRTKIKYGVNRIYRVSELTDKFGQPDSVKESRQGTSTTHHLPESMKSIADHDYEAEEWTWKCPDGEIKVHFLVAGYGTQGDEKTKRLLLFATPKLTKNK